MLRHDTAQFSGQQMFGKLDSSMVVYAPILSGSE